MWPNIMAFQPTYCTPLRLPRAVINKRAFTIRGLGRSMWLENHNVFRRSMKRALVNALSEAGKHMDIGIMQINSYWHGHRVESLPYLFDPLVNLHIGAVILGEQKKRSASWWEAVGRYHAPNNDLASLKRAEKYRQRVKKIHQKIIEEY